MSTIPDAQDLAKQVEELTARIAIMEKIILRIEGAGILVKILVYLVAPVGAIGYAFRNHWSW